MKMLRLLYFLLSAFSALIYLIMLCNLLSGRIYFGAVLLAVIILVVEIVGLIAVIRNRNINFMSIVTAFAGIATALSGNLAFSFLKVPSSEFIGNISSISLLASYILAVLYIILSFLFLNKAK